MSISKRITWFSTVWLFILLVLVNSGIYILFGQMTARVELERVSLQTQNIAEAIRTDRGGATNAGDILRAYAPGNGLIRVIRENGEPFILTTKNFDLREMPAHYSIQQQTKQIQFNGDRYAVSYFPVIWNDGSVVTLEYSEQMTTYESTLTTLRLVLFIASILVIVPVFLAGRALAKVILRPIQELTKTMENIRKKGTFERINVKEESKDEIDQLGKTFNEMIKLLEENFEKQQQFVSDASHELRTPLTVIESYANLLKRWGKSKPELLEEAIEAIAEESSRMKGLTKQMLALATGNQEKVQLVELNISQLTIDIARRLELAFNRQIHVEVLSERFMNADEAQIKQLLFILLENGLKYSELPVYVEISEQERFVKINIRDQGIGIPERDLPHVFERFFRVDKARSRETGGSGLGLAIAKTIITSHNGQITVNSIENVGTTFTVLLPYYT
ncbi:sensor histidine kinase [Halalkalibacter akibai]|uniref:histidine kinase n=1 Tax=Halalkalibacter akibai (strain ATCC 43226 / DSM 21942 / CIP 109018 / JCM 9157 / 1139) TaxID=1236973 RepID=W4QU78_HALA3|nr:ATP-binding protein [Halalkalibacter akibai]GAE35636.1 hypothetical protein JCM9157_2753 [Halalkalibacter akibai JCM 9157]